MHLSVRLLTLEIVQRVCENFCSYCKINKLKSVLHASAQLLIMNFVITLSKKLWIHEAIAKWIRRL